MATAPINPAKLPRDAMPFVPPGELIVADEQGHLYDAGLREILWRRLGSGSLVDREASEVIGALHHAGKVVRQRMEEALAQFGITHQQFKTMMWIHNCGKEGTHLHRIASSLGVTPRNVTGLVDGLEALGLAERVSDPADRRALIARLTPAGEARVAAASRVHQRLVRQMGQSLTEEERVALRHACLKLAQVIEAGAVTAKEKTNG